MPAFGLNFRNTAGYVTDIAPDIYVLADAYPTTRGNITFGWDDIGATLTEADRDAAQGARFAGGQFPTLPTTARTFRVDLPQTGVWRVRASFGDATLARVIFAVLKDNVTTFATIDGATTLANRYLDATGVERTSPADWTSNNVAVTRTFGSTAFFLTLADGALKNGTVTHLDFDLTDFTFIKPWMIA